MPEPQVRRNLVSLEYVPAMVAFAVKGGGLGVGYERKVNDFLSLQGILAGGGVPADNDGVIAFAGMSFNAVLSPVRTQRSFKVILGGALNYIGAFGEESQDGLESHFYIPSLQSSAGWRFFVGKGKVRFTIQPELTVAFLFPGPTGSGVKDELEWSTTGYYMLMFYPNVSLGVNF